MVGFTSNSMVLVLLSSILLLDEVYSDGSCSSALLMNVSMTGHDLKPVTKRHANSAAECCSMCASEPKCTVWTWVENTTVPAYEHVCWFKESIAGHTNTSGHISGITATPTPTPPLPCSQGSSWCPPPFPPLPPPEKPPIRICKTCKKPIFSWDKLPAFLHGCEQDAPGGGFTNKTLEVIKHFPLVTMEKWQGDQVMPYMWEEDAWVAGAKQIKAINPDIAVVVWLDSFRIYDANKTLNPDLNKQCTTGHFRPAEYLDTHPDMLLMNTSNKPALEPWSHCHIFDFTKPSVQAYWTEMCLNMTDSGVVDGCGADASWQLDPTGGTTAPDVRAAWDIGHRTMMRDTSLALGNGMLLGKDPWELGYHVNGVLHESCGADNVTINTLRNLSIAAAATPRAGANFSGPLIYECHGTGKLDEVAAFLIGAGEYHFYGFGGWQGMTPGHYSADLMDQKLGAPDGVGVYDQVTESWSRTFAGGNAAGGTTVKFFTKNSSGTIQWSK